MYQGAQDTGGGLPLVTSKTEPSEQDMKSSPPNSSSKKRMLESYSPTENDDDKFPDDDKHAKKQRRLVKNREAAAQFRHRQKAYMQKLEKHAEDLTTSNLQVTAKIELLDSENKLMKEQLGYLRNFMKQAVALSFPNSLPSLPPDSVVASSPDLYSPLPDIGDTTNLTPNTTTSSTNPLINPPIATNSNPDTLTISGIINNTFLNPNPIPKSHITPTNLNTTPNSTANSTPITTPPAIPSVTNTPNTKTTPDTPTNPTAHTPLTISSIINNNTFLNTLGNSSSLNNSSPLTGSNSLSSIFNSILGTDLNFSGVLVKTEPPEGGFGDSH